MATHGLARIATIRALTQREAFKRAGYGMRAIEGKGDTGRLPLEYYAAYKGADVVYTVYSYATPIAWVTSDGKVVCPDVKYSSTTTSHQRLCQTYL